MERVKTTKAKRERVKAFKDAKRKEKKEVESPRKSPRKSSRRLATSAAATPDDSKNTRWVNSKAPALTNSELTKASELIRESCSKEPSYVLFAERTIQEYKQLQKSGPLHLNIRKVFKAAVGQMMQQVRPKSARPCHGNSTTVMQDLLPVVNKFFNIKQKKRPGSREHQQQLFDEDVYTLHDYTLYPLVMAHHIKTRK